MKENIHSYRRAVVLSLILLVLLAAIVVFFMRPSTGSIPQTDGHEAVIPQKEPTEKQPDRTVRKSARRKTDASRNTPPEKTP
jgi:hypothetical protein